MEPEKNKKAPQCKSAGAKKSRRTAMAAEMDMVQSSARSRNKNIKAKERTNDFDAVNDSSDDDSVEIESRVKALQRLVPGGENMGVETLFEETADYLEELRGQVMMMRSLADFIDAVNREKWLMRR